jgi:hypothetical protein
MKGRFLENLQNILISRVTKNKNQKQKTGYKLFIKGTIS